MGPKKPEITKMNGDSHIFNITYIYVYIYTFIYIYIYIYKDLWNADSGKLSMSNLEYPGKVVILSCLVDIPSNL